MSARSWTAPVLWRFGTSRENDGDGSFIVRSSCPEAKSDREKQLPTTSPKKAFLPTSNIHM